jgi:hypothetical protein
VVNATGQVLLEQGYYQRAVAAIDRKHLRWAYVIGGIVAWFPIPLVFGLVVGGTGLAMGFGAGAELESTSDVAPYVMSNVLGPVAGILFAIMVFVAATSTADTSLAGAQSLFTVDVYERYWRKGRADERLQLRFGRIVTVIYGFAGMLVALGLAAAGSTGQTPRAQADLCRVLEQRPYWYGYARDAEQRWGTPIPVLMAFVQFESGFRNTARPPRQYLLGFIPWRWRTSAYGYPQAKDGTWSDYLDANPGPFRKRTDMDDALDFIGWYNHLSAAELGIAKTDARNLYLAYHEGRTGYRRGDWQHDGAVQGYAARVAKRADEYTVQLEQCREQVRCGRWYQFWPFCG